MARTTKYRYGQRRSAERSNKVLFEKQLLTGLVGIEDDPTGRYSDILTYERQLEPDEMDAHNLTFVGMRE